jgi:ATP-dependent RNA helicase DDX1
MVELESKFTSETTIRIQANDSPFGKGDVIGCHLEIAETQAAADKKDPVAVRIAFSRNREFFGEAFQMSPKFVKAGDALFPTVCLENAECSFWFGVDSDDDKAEPCKFALPPDYKPHGWLCSNGNGGESIPRDASFARSSGLALGGAPQLGPLAIVIEPTRDLAEQTYHAFVDLAVHMTQPPVKSALLVGGLSPNATL